VAYRDIVRLARRFTHTDADARDLAQDALTAALDRGFADWASPARRPWLWGVLRKRAAFVARTGARRAQREQTASAVAEGSPVAWAWRPSFLAALPPSLRVVATLASADLCAAEMRWLLRLTPESLRTRLSALRRAVRAEAEPPTLASSQPAAALGPNRVVLLAGLKATKLPMVATHDPDGHAIFFRAVAHEKGRPGNS
jgi:DNA-directed RNA polymerase specialized sigma24 family protein